MVSLSPSSDQHQNCPCNINVQLIAQVSRILEMITRDELFWYLNNFSQLALQQMYGDQ